MGLQPIFVMSTAERVKGVFLLADVDNSGALGIKEISYLISFGEEEDPDNAEFLADVDTNKDGKLSLEELQAFFELKEKNLGEKFADFMEGFENKGKAARTMATHDRVEAM